MQSITVVNEMLGTMGETPLNSLTEPHAFRGAALAALENARKEVLSTGWQFNTENLTLSPGGLDSNIYLPGDFLACDTGDSNITVRDGRLYNLSGGAYTFASPVTVRLIRDIPFDELPEVPARAIATLAVLNFQTTYDGDSTKARAIEKRQAVSMAAMRAEETRARRANILDSNPTLARIRRAHTYFRKG